MTTTHYAVPLIHARAAPPLTFEQQAAVSAALGGHNFKLSARAGTGKTSTAGAVARALVRPGTAVTYNRSAADELKARLPATCDCRSMHSLAFGYCAGRLRLPVARLNTNFSIRHYRNPDFTRHEVPIFARELISQALKRFHQSRDQAPALHHVRNPNDIIVGDDQKVAAGHIETWRAWALGWVQHIWAEQTTLFSDTPIGGDGYLKVWSLSNPQIKGDYLLVDEAQDVNPVFHHVIDIQRSQCILIGDRYQQLYDWRGARDAMEQFAWPELHLTQSFRFGPELAHEAAQVLRALGCDEAGLIRGDPGKHTVIAPAGAVDAVISRTNAGAFSAAMEAIQAGRPVYADSKNVTALRALVSDVQRLEAGRAAEGRDLLGFNTMREVEEYAATDEGAQLRTVVALVKKLGSGGLSGVLARIEGSPVAGGLSVSTAHSAKGLQWPRVQIAGDFMRGSKITDAERRLTYVAMTRAERLLVIDPEMLGEYQRTKAAGS
jgi:hypothetical protein